MKKTISIFIITVMCLSLFSCAKNNAQADLWEDATYTEDMTFGTGEKVVEVEVIAQEKAVTFTINTDKETLGEALLEYKLITGEQGAYGIYIKAVNGITADYDVDKSYWAVTKADEYMMTGVDSEKISGGEHYELTYTK